MNKLRRDSGRNFDRGPGPWRERYGAALAGLTEEDVHAVEVAMQQHTYEKGQTIRGPERGRGGIFALAAGAALLSWFSPHGERVPLCHRRTKGHVFALGGTGRTVEGTVVAEVAADETAVYSLAWSSFLRIAAAHPRVATGLALVERQNEEEKDEFIRELASCDGQTRLLHALALLAMEREDHMVWETHEEIAWEAVISREEVTKGLPRLRERGLIAFEPHHRGIRVSDPDRLMDEYRRRAGM